MRVLVAVVSICLLPHLAKGDLLSDFLEPPDYVACISAVEPLSTFARSHLQIQCAAIMEKWCLAPIRKDDAETCFRDSLESTRAYRAEISARLPESLPTDISEFDARMYSSALGRLSKTREETDCRAGVPKSACEFFEEAFLLWDAFNAARIAGTKLP